MQAKSAALTHWAHLAATMAASQALPHLEAHRQLLQILLDEAQELSATQSAHTSAKQVVTKRLQTVLDQGQKLANFLRTGIRQHYGNRSEELVAYGIQPFRGRPQPVEPARPPVELAEPEATSAFLTE